MFNDKKKAQTGYGNYEVRMTADLIEYLCGDYSYKDARRFSRLQAFQDLVARYCASREKEEDMAANIERLSKSWGWSRPSVMRFVQILEAMEVLKVFTVVTSTMVRLRNGIVIFHLGEDFRP